MTTKYLIQRFTEQGIGRIFIATEVLLTRADMHPYDGPVPEGMIVKIGEAALEGPRLAPHKMDFETGASTATETKPMVDPFPPETTQEYPGAAPDAKIDITAVEDDPPMADLDDVEAPTPVTPDLSPNDKIAKLVEIMENKTLFPQDDDHYTGQGLPRIDALIHALGADVQSAERIKAYEIFKKKNKQ